MIWTLLASGLVNLVAGAAFVRVGLHFRRRPAEPANRLAVRAFAAYWIGVGLYVSSWGGVLDVLASFGVAPFGLFLAARYASLPIACAALGALMFYFAFLFTGRRAWIWISALAYAATLAAGAWYVWARDPVGVSVQAWRTDLAYASPFGSPALNAIVLMLVLPPMLGALAYATLARRAPTDAARRRILLVSAALFLWNGSALFARLSDDDFWQLVTRPVAGLAAAALALYAYREGGGA
ncbi:MAG TPA: hypothetical protein VHH36_03005 [Candidatus Thermoplasmatota archaeon]|nr:hypothetical protein [Candidatus Thermoplasmatota archaeon]